ncbi:vanadium-dependent haloperoxidase [Agrilutibacter solisilvae]|uniref:Vanadium-dependent haloperoxidase n=1 Tax=Agrilutibacter solisilvae TaxID=2763317 RepID=A0A975ATD2_9GAMM|nr:vanadium-dependent haloperoxidase [Lysobacter solisilvae]QSX78880.1 vanadium-dependent haloperoxidase [Lysobacter solisilvae]
MNRTTLACRLPARRWLPVIAIGLALAAPAQADSVTDWNAVAGSPAVLPRFGGPQQQNRAMAIVQIAVHDALNAIQPRYRSYNAIGAAPAGASPDAAVAAATRTTLLTMLGALPPAPTPVEATNRANAIVAVNAAFDAAIGPGAPDAAEAAGIATGDAAALAILSLRYVNTAGVWTPIDGSGTPNSPPYALSAGLGIHQPTPAPEFPAVTVPAFTGWPAVRPFALDSSSQFRSPPGAIFNIASAQYADACNQVKQQGSARVRGAFPNSHHSDVARFWAGGALEWNGNARIIVAARGMDRWQHARMFALMNMAVADSMINNLESKYHYNFWRPVTAIRWPDDGNPATASDPAWRPFLQTPPYPDYPCASTSVTGAAAGTLRRFFGTNAIHFTRTINAGAVPLPAPMTELPPKVITRHYGSLSIAENEQARSRVYAGLHFAEGCYAGLRAGNQVADWVYARYLRPL